MTNMTELKVNASKLGKERCPSDMDFLDLGNGDWAWIPKDMKPIKIEEN